MRDILRLSHGQLAVFAGVLGYESFWLGAQGWVSAPANLAPRGCAQLFILCADNHDQPAALALYNQLMPAILAASGRRAVCTVKAALAMLGRAVGEPRPPRLPLPGPERLLLREALVEAGLLGD